MKIDPATPARDAWQRLRTADPKLKNETAWRKFMAELITPEWQREMGGGNAAQAAL